MSKAKKKYETIADMDITKYFVNIMLKKINDVTEDLIEELSPLPASEFMTVVSSILTAKIAAQSINLCPDDDLDDLRDFQTDLLKEYFDDIAEKEYKDSLKLSLLNIEEE
jgi:hypothetical protein